MFLEVVCVCGGGNVNIHLTQRFKKCTLHYTLCLFLNNNNQKCRNVIINTKSGGYFDLRVLSRNQDCLKCERV